MRKECQGLREEIATLKGTVQYLAFEMDDMRYHLSNREVMVRLEKILGKGLANLIPHGRRDECS